MKTIAVYIIIDGAYKAMELTGEQVGQLAELLRKDGRTRVQTTKGDYMAEGIYIPARGLKKSILMFDMEESGD